MSFKTTLNTTEKKGEITRNEVGSTEVTWEQLPKLPILHNPHWGPCQLRFPTPIPPNGQEPAQDLTLSNGDNSIPFPFKLLSLNEAERFLYSIPFLFDNV